jgi:hypothetical protein
VRTFAALRTSARSMRCTRHCTHAPCTHMRSRAHSCHVSRGARWF